MTFKLTRRSIPEPAQPQNRAAVSALRQAVNELSGTVGPALQRAVRLGELVAGGLMRTKPDGTAEVDAERIVATIRANPRARAALAAYLTFPGHLDGLLLATNGSDVEVSPGSAWVPALGYAVGLPDGATVPITATANTWFHLYLYVSAAGVVSVETSTTAPASPYSGKARFKAGDSTRRYIGSVRTDGAGAPLPIDMRGELVTYVADVTAAPYRVLTNGTNNTATAVDCSAVVPVSSRLVHLYFTNPGTAGIGFATGAGLTGTRSTINPNQSIELEFPLDENQDFYYQCFVGTPPANGLYADVWGYTLER